MKSVTNTLGIYVQVPFCQTKCTYCNFHTGVVSAGRFAPYAEAVCKEIRGWGLRGSGEWRVASGQQEMPELVVDTIYVGGGTPSLLEAGGFGEKMEAILA